jgi:hypothetical protein
LEVASLLTVKTCSRCKAPKSLDEFARNRAARDRLQNQCKDCQREYRDANRASIAEKNRLYRLANREKLLERNRAYYRANRDPFLEKCRERRAANPEAAAARRRSAGLRRRYGITVEQYDEMLAAQGGVCALCGTDQPGGRGEHFSVDHCHKDGHVRGLLCAGCNTNLGAYEKMKANPLTERYLESRGA